MTDEDEITHALLQFVPHEVEADELAREQTYAKSANWLSPDVVPFGVSAEELRTWRSANSQTCEGNI